MQQYAHLPPDAEHPTWTGPREAIRIPNHPRANLLTDAQLAQHHIYPADLDPIPESSRIIDQSWTIIDNRAIQTAVTYETPEDQATAAEAEFDATVERAADAVRALAKMLSLFGLAIPIEGGAQAATAAIQRAAAAGQIPDAQLALVGTLDAAYRHALALCGDEPTLRLIHQAIQQQESTNA